MSTLKRLAAGLLVALLIVVGGAVAFAQGGETPVPTETPDFEEVQFIGEPPGNNQTGEWEGEYEYEDGAAD